jgi:hypothetical protein
MRLTPPPFLRDLHHVEESVKSPARRLDRGFLRSRAVEPGEVNDSGDGMPRADSAQEVEVGNVPALRDHRKVGQLRWHAAGSALHVAVVVESGMISRPFAPTRR